MTIQLPNDPKLAVKVIEAEAAKNTQRGERGVMGAIFGVSKEKPGNIAGFAIIVSCVMILIIAFIPSSPDFPKKELITLFGSLIPGALGYVFGAVKSE